MTLKQAIRIVEQHQRWRRDPNVPPRTKMVNPIDVGKAIDVLVLVAKEYAKIDDIDKVYRTKSKEYMNKREKIKEQYELLTEIESLQEIVVRASNSRCTPIHFELVEHYGNLSDYHRRDIKPKHSDRIIQLLKEIILELGDELHKLENNKTT